MDMEALIRTSGINSLNHCVFRREVGSVASPSPSISLASSGGCPPDVTDAKALLQKMQLEAEDRIRVLSEALALTERRLPTAFKENRQKRTESFFLRSKSLFQTPLDETAAEKPNVSTSPSSTPIKSDLKWRKSHRERNRRVLMGRFYTEMSILLSKSENTEVTTHLGMEVLNRCGILSRALLVLMRALPGHGLDPEMAKSLAEVDDLSDSGDLDLGACSSEQEAKRKRKCIKEKKRRRNFKTLLEMIAKVLKIDGRKDKTVILTLAVEELRRVLKK